MNQSDQQSWQEMLSGLRRQAWEASRNAYAPYSHYPVGAAALVDDGRIITGCNVENVSTGLGLCAECSIVSQLYATGGGRLKALSCTDAQGSVIMPCGRCRQLLFEHGGDHLIIDHEPADPAQLLTLGQLLPYAFGPGERHKIG